VIFGGRLTIISKVPVTLNLYSFVQTVPPPCPDEKTNPDRHCGLMAYLAARLAVCARAYVEYPEVVYTLDISDVGDVVD